MFEKKPVFVIEHNLESVEKEYKRDSFDQFFFTILLVLQDVVFITSIFIIIKNGYSIFHLLIVTILVTGLMLLNAIIYAIVIIEAMINKKFLEYHAKELMLVKGINYYWGTNLPAIKQYPVVKTKKE